MLCFCNAWILPYTMVAEVFMQSVSECVIKRLLNSSKLSKIRSETLLFLRFYNGV